jgi:hypothetical protein
VISSCTYRQAVKHCAVLTQCIEALLRISESTAIICPYIINFLLFITERRCAYCAVRAVSLKCNAANCSWRSGFDARSVRVRFVVHKVALGRHFSPSTSVFPSLHCSTKSSVLLFAYSLPLPEGRTDETWRTSKKHCCLGSRIALGSNSFHLVWRLKHRSFRTYIQVLKEVMYDLLHHWVYRGSE